MLKSVTDVAIESAWEQNQQNNTKQVWTMTRAFLGPGAVVLSRLIKTIVSMDLAQLIKKYIYFLLSLCHDSSFLILEYMEQWNLFSINKKFNLVIHMSEG